MEIPNVSEKAEATAKAALSYIKELDKIEPGVLDYVIAVCVGNYELRKSLEELAGLVRDHTIERIKKEEQKIAGKSVSSVIFDEYTPKE